MTSDRHYYFTAEGETYYRYRLDEDAGTWSREEISDSTYTDEITRIRQSVAPYLQWIAPYCEELTANNGTYTADLIESVSLFNSNDVTDLVIVVEGGALKSVSYSVTMNRSDFVFTLKFGNDVQITPPTDYTEAE